MRRRILIVPDKFKGTLTAREAAEAIARGWSKACPDDVLELLPMSDGGDGFGQVLGDILHADVRYARTLDAAHRRHRAAWRWEGRTRTAIIESANVIGLALLPPGRFHPFDLDTFGLGALLQAAAKRGARRCIVGIGGSATNDGGFGLARALGWSFADHNGRSIERWTELQALADIRVAGRRKLFRELIVAADVRNPLLGVKGATRVYGPQKGLRGGDLALAERCLRRLAQVFDQKFGRSPAAIPGAGAAGGLGFGFMAFAGARVQSGFDRFAELSRLEHKLRRADLVITAEGRLDGMTVMGKGVGEVAKRCRRLGVPCLALGGDRDRAPAWKGSFAAVHALTDLTSLKQAKAAPAYWLERLAAWSAGKLLVES